MSLKNSKRVIRVGGRPRIVPSAPYQRWAKKALQSVKQSEHVGREWSYPLRASFHFVRRTRHRFDYINLAQGPLDLLVEAGVIEDDDMAHVVPGEFSWSVDKDNPRTYVRLEETGPADHCQEKQKVA